MFSGQRMKLILLIVVGLAAVAIGFVFVPPGAAVAFVQHGGYYFIAASTAAWAVALVRLVRVPGGRPEWIAADWRLGALALGIAILWQTQGMHAFKVLMDEYVLGATAMSMHFDREVFVPLKTHDINGVYATLGGIVDKRPLFFPFLVSLLHDATGYRPANVFALNAVLSFLLLFLTGRVARRLGGQEHAGTLGVVLLGGLPLLASNASGAAFEVLNLFMIVVVLALGRRYLERLDETTLDAFVLSGVLLAQTRYESALFFGAVGLVILWGWWRARRMVISWGLVATPVLLLPVPLLNKIFALNRDFWQVREGGGSPFGFDYFVANVGHAMTFFFTVDGFQLGSPVLSAAGLACAIFFALFVLRRWRASSADAALVVCAALGVVIVGNFVLLLCYHWGQLDDYMASRLGLPLLLFFALATAFAVGRWIKRAWLWVPVLGGAAIWAWFAGISITATGNTDRTFISHQEVQWQEEILRDRPGERIFFALPSPLPAVLARRPAIAVDVLAERAEEMAFHLREKTYREVLVFQRIEIDPATHAERLHERSLIGPEFVLETVEERRFKPLTISRLSRLVSVDPSRAAPRPADWRPNFPPFYVNLPHSGAGAEGTYLDEFLQKLP
jgi:hypothetical protein